MNENETALMNSEESEIEADAIMETEISSDGKEAEIAALQKELTLSKIKVALLLAGVLREKLDEGATIALGLCSAGKTPEAAADEVAAAYPHLKAVQREIPQFAAGGTGSADGFSAIRKIFMGR